MVKIEQESCAVKGEARTIAPPTPSDPLADDAATANDCGIGWGRNNVAARRGPEV